MNAIWARSSLSILTPSGMGRTGTLHAWEQEGVAPDIQVVAKGLGGGYQPIGAMLATGRIVDTIREGSGAFQHGHTYLAHPLAWRRLPRRLPRSRAGRY